MRSMASSDVKQFFLRWRKELVGSAVLVGLASAVLLLLWKLEQITLVGQVTVVQIITGLLVLVGLYWTSRRVLAAEENVRVAEEGQITERFTRAIEQLGHEEMAIRLGGIYALERIAKDSEKDHGPIMEVLTAYVREKANKLKLDVLRVAERPPTDIQATLTVISRRKTTDMKRLDDFFDLTNTHLAGVTLYKADLHGANLSEANLSGASLHGVNLSGASLHRVNLSRALLIGVNLSEAILHGADLHGADLRGAKNLTEEQVREAENWEEAILPDYLEYLLAPKATYDP